MRTLLVTSQASEDKIKRIADKFDGYKVFVSKSDVAACMPVDGLIDHLKDNKYDQIIVPGTIGWDLYQVGKQLGTEVFKGPKDIADLEFILENIDEIELSKETPACELIKEKMQAKALAEIKKVDTEEYKERMLKKPGNILVGDLPLGPDFPIRVLSEIVDATHLSTENLKKRAEYFIASGADIVDIGVNEKDPEGIEIAINTLREYDIPLSIDTMEAANIEKALELNIDMIMSFDHTLLNQFSDIETPVVIIPKKETIPKDYNQKINILDENIGVAKERGFKTLIADLILEPLNFGFTDSVTAYTIFSDSHEALPILLGTGNVTELIDADSVGINALLSGIAMELNASIVFTPEQSDKAKGSTEELATASKMMYLAKKRGSAPKDLGIDLLSLKDKHIRRDTFHDTDYKNVNVIESKIIEEEDYDPKVFFKIFVEDDIKVVYYKEEKPTLVIKGKNAKEISDTIIGKSLITDMSHALYLGRELEKAEVALKTGKSYVQDEAVF